MHTPDQIEAWARESGLFIGFDGNVYTKEPIDGIAFSDLATFAALVAASERERVRVALLAEAGKWVGDFRMPVHRAISDGATAAGLNITRDDCAAAIRKTYGG